MCEHYTDPLLYAGSFEIRSFPHTILQTQTHDFELGCHEDIGFTAAS